MKYVDDIELALVGNEVVVTQINFRDSICKPCQELYDNGYIDTIKPMILCNVLGSVRFSNYLPEEEVSEIIMRLRQYYDVSFAEARLMESPVEQQNQVALYLFNIFSTK